MYGFALLLGEPAVGRSVIALMLALAAADNWTCRTSWLRSAGAQDRADLTQLRAFVEDLD